MKKGFGEDIMGSFKTASSVITSISQAFQNERKEKGPEE